jgi:hypothetical protein
MTEASATFATLSCYSKSPLASGGVYTPLGYTGALLFKVFFREVLLLSSFFPGHQPNLAWITEEVSTAARLL